MRATIRDVAKTAGVSVATVSRAKNGADNVLPDTKARILEAAAALRFTTSGATSGAARGVITRRTDTVGTRLPDLHCEYFSEPIRGIDQAARARGLHMRVSSSHDDADEAAARKGNHESRERKRGYKAGLARGAKPMVFEVDFDEESGWAAGRRIAKITPRRGAVFAANDMMATGCMAALGEAGLRVPEDVAIAGFDDWRGGPVPAGKPTNAVGGDTLNLGKPNSIRGDTRAFHLAVGLKC